MRYFKVLSILFWAGLLAPGYAAETTTYWPGFEGSISQFQAPLDATHAKDRYLTLKIRIPAKPNAKTRAYDSAFHAVCQRHQGDLLKTAKKLSPRNDWRVKVTFEWPVSASNGVSMGMQEYRFMHLSNCRMV